MSLEKIVAFDIDDVLFPLRDLLVREFNKRFGTDLKIDSCDCFSFTGWLARDHPEAHQTLMKNGGKFGFFRYVSERNMLIDTQPYDRAAETVRNIKAKSYKIAIVSYRGTLEEPSKFYVDGPRETMEWLRKFNIPYDYVRFTDKKAEALSEIRRESGKEVILFVEDHPANIIPVVKLGFNVAIMDKPYNRARLINGVEDETDYGRGTYTQADWSNVLEADNVFRASSICDVEWILKVIERQENPT